MGVILAEGGLRLWETLEDNDLVILPAKNNKSNTTCNKCGMFAFFGRAYHTCSCKKSLIISLSEETATARCLVAISRAIAVMFNAT